MAASVDFTISFDSPDDDGWIVARERALPEAGGLTNYYDALGTNLPNEYWLEWLQHWLSQASDALLVWRLPALVSLSALWFLCRWSLRRAGNTEKQE